MEITKRLTMTTMLALSLLVFTLLSPIEPVSAQELPVPREQTVIVDGETDIYTVFDSFNPFIPQGDPWGSGWHSITHEWDYYINTATGQIRYWRVTGWEYQDDYTTFILHVRPGVTWNDGEPLTAHDYVFTIEMLSDYPELIGSADVTQYVSSVEAADDYTVIFHLKGSYPRFHQNLRMWGPIHIIPKHIWEGKDPTTFKNFPPVDTGPYKLFGVYPELNMFVWERYEDYWGKKLGYFPAPKYVVFRTAQAVDVMFSDFIAGNDDAPMLFFFTWDMVKKAQEVTPNMTYVEYQDPYSYAFLINENVYPLNLREVRWAISYCVDRETLSSIYPMAEKPDVAKYPWATAAYKLILDKYGDMAERVMQRIENEYGYTYEYNPDKAAEILDSLDFIDRDGDGVRETPNGTVLSFEIITGPAGVMEYLQGMDLAENLRSIGVDATVKALDWGMMGDSLDELRFEIGSWIYSSSTPWTGDLIGALEVGETPYQEYWYFNPELNETVNELARLSPDDPVALALYEEALYMLVRDLPAITTVEQFTVQPYSTTYWTGWPEKDNLYEVPYTWWPSFEFVLFQIKPVRAPVPVVTTVTETLRETVTETTTRTTTATAPAVTVTSTVTETAAVETVTETTTKAVTTMDITSVAGAGIVALIIGVVVGWLVGKK